ncbi:hypothetical protein LEM8419_01592 [Neolewinella maritima]|uniref:YcaO domain-containing protein n=1 Tax=Neolewinella maritima TaxID=1383882 RepID=A0ABM9B0Y2_9BACT|nr:YcaO-like family protein [Neolewinella maritima]CAH1000439.1 hypothetical protein LEM8419_01592 [Neolewinella maritima]
MSSQHERALAAYRDSLPGGVTETFRIDGVDHLGIPIYNVDLFTDDGHFNGIGYGATETEALVGAYGELAEECHRHLSLADLSMRESSYAALLEEVGSAGVLDPLTLVLPAGSAYTPDLVLKWLPVARLKDNRTVWCPAEFVVSGNWELPDYPNRLTTCITNGMGAGDTEERALLHGLLELLQRDGNADRFRALDRGQVIDPATVTEPVREIIAYMKERGLDVTMKLARVTCGCASVYAVGDDLSDDAFGLAATGCGEAADPDVYHALRKAVLECASSHSRKRFNNLPFEQLEHEVPEGYFTRIRAAIDLETEEQRALRAMVEFVRSDKETVRQQLADTIFNRQTTVSAADLPSYTATDVPSRLQYVIQQLAGEGMEPYVYRSTSTRGSCSVVKAIVPDMEMEFGSYHRVGYRGVKRLLADDPFHLLKRAPGPGLALIRLTEARNQELDGPFYLNTSRLDEIIDPLYALYREPTAHAAPIALATDYFADL